MSLVLQGLVLTPVMSAAYINDVVDGVFSYVNLLADYAELLR